MSLVIKATGGDGGRIMEAVVVVHWLGFGSSGNFFFSSVVDFVGMDVVARKTMRLA